MALLSEDAEVRTLLDGTLRGHEAIRAMIRRVWEEMDARLEFRDVEDANERRAVATADFIVTAGGMEQRQVLAYLFVFAGQDEDSIDAIELFQTLDEAWQAVSADS